MLGEKRPEDVPTRRALRTRQVIPPGRVSEHRGEPGRPEPKTRRRGAEDEAWPIKLGPLYMALPNEASGSGSDTESARSPTAKQHTLCLHLLSPNRWHYFRSGACTVCCPVISKPEQSEYTLWPLTRLHFMSTVLRCVPGMGARVEAHNGELGRRLVRRPAARMSSPRHKGLEPAGAT